MHASFLQPRDGSGFLRIAGSVGGPSVFTQIYEIRQSQLVHRFTALEIYGELNECTFDGKPFEKEMAQSFLKFLPPTRDPYIYWMNVEE